jgi:hypothetical protein
MFNYMKTRNIKHNVRWTVKENVEATFCKKRNNVSAIKCTEKLRISISSCTSKSTSSGCQ